MIPGRQELAVQTGLGPLLLPNPSTAVQKPAVPDQLDKHAERRSPNQPGVDTSSQSIPEKPTVPLDTDLLLPAEDLEEIWKLVLAAFI